MCNPTAMVQSLIDVKRAIDGGEDFSQALKQLQARINELEDPESFNFESICKKSAAAASFMRWLLAIIDYCKDKNPKLETILKSAAVPIRKAGVSPGRKSSASPQKKAPVPKAK